MSMPRPRLVPNQLNSITINKPLKWIPANSYREKKTTNKSLETEE